MRSSIIIKSSVSVPYISCKKIFFYKQNKKKQRIKTINRNQNTEKKNKDRQIRSANDEKFKEETAKSSTIQL